MTAKEQRFVEAFTGEAKFNATQAAKIAGYSAKTAYSIGSRLKKQFASQIQERLDELTMSSGEVLKRLTEIARNEASLFIKVRKSGMAKGQAYIDADAMIKAGKAHLIKGIKPKEFGVEVVTQDPQSALELLARHHGLVKEKVEHSGPEGGPITITEVVVELPDGGDEPDASPGEGDTQSLPG